MLISFALFKMSTARSSVDRLCPFQDVKYMAPILIGSMLSESGISIYCGVDHQSTLGVDLLSTFQVLNR